MGKKVVEVTEYWISVGQGRKRSEEDPDKWEIVRVVKCIQRAGLTEIIEYATWKNKSCEMSKFLILKVELFWITESGNESTQLKLGVEEKVTRD